MYNVSQQYLTDLQNSVQIENHITATLFTNVGARIEISDKQIIPNSVKLDRRSTDGKFNLGSVYISQLSITLLLDNVTAESLYKGTIELVYHYTLSDNTIEDIKIGKYYINQVSSTKKLFTLTCYDGLYLFDDPVDIEIEGSTYEAIQYMCDVITGVDFGMTKSEVEALPNGNLNVKITSEQIDTYRDALSQIATMLGCFVTINRDNKLVLKPFSTSSVRTYNKKQRVKSTLYIDKTRIAKVTARFLQEENYVNYVEETGNEGATLDLGDISLYAGLDADTKHEILSRVASVLQDIEYMPCSITTFSESSLDVGDMISVVKDDNTTVNSIITHISFNYHKEMQIDCEGLDMRQSFVKSSTNKAISRVSGGSGGLSSVVVKSGLYDNTLISANSQKEILFLYLKFKNNTPVLCNTNLIISAEEDCDVECNFIINKHNCPDNYSIHISAGTYRYALVGVLPLEFIGDFSGSQADVTLALKPSANIVVKEFSTISAVAADVTNTPETPSIAEDFDFNINWLTLDAGLYREDSTLVASWGQLKTDGLNISTDKSSSSAGSGVDEILNNYPEGKVFVIDGSLLETEEYTLPDKTKAERHYFPRYCFGANAQYVRTVIFKNQVYLHNNPFYKNNSIENIYLPSGIGFSSSNAGPNTAKTLVATLYTSLRYGSSAFYEENNSWDKCDLSYQAELTGFTSSARCGVIWNINENTDLSYKVGEGEQSAGLRFNISDLELAPGFYDSANRLIVAWDKLRTLGIDIDTYKSGFYNSKTFPYNQPADFSGKGGVLSLAKLYKRATKVILPDSATFDRIAGRVMSGVAGNIQVLVCPHPIGFGEYCFQHNTNLKHIYIDKDSTRLDSYGGFRSVSTDLLIYTNASSTSDFVTRLRILQDGSTLSLSNIVFDVGV